MKNALRKEMMWVCGIGALVSLALRRNRWALQFGATAAGLALLKDKPFSFKRRSAVVTGGSRGLGLALAETLVREKAQVTLLARDLAELERAKERLLALDPDARVLILQCDVTDDQNLKSAVAEILGTFGVIDLWINNAGAITVGPLDATTREEFEAQLELHFYAVLSATREILPHFRERGGGRIVNICSMGGKIAVPHMLPYDVSKFAMAGLSQGLAAELDRENISVTTVYPTLMKTGSPIQAVFMGDHDSEFQWFATADSLPGLSQRPDVTAKKILEATRERRAELLPTFLGRVRLAAGVFIPELMMWTMSAMNRLMPKGTSKMLATGAESRDRLDRSPLTSVASHWASSAEARWNQEPRTDAAFNLGLKSRPVAFDP